MSHVYEARKEMMLALRSLIYRAIEMVEEKEKVGGTGQKQDRHRIGKGWFDATSGNRTDTQCCFAFP
jgi:hypothetical protein